MVIALGLPVPRFPGNPLDPPLRSRFQARAVPPLPAALRKDQLRSLGPPHGAASLAGATDALDALDALHALRSAGGADYALPCAPAANLVSIARLHAALPAATPAALLPRLLPHAASSSELRSLLERFGLTPPPTEAAAAAAAGGGGGGAAGSAAGYALHELRAATPAEAAEAAA
eukprot:2435605-Prymnesium_polylepis.1